MTTVVPQCSRFGLRPTQQFSGLSSSFRFVKEEKWVLQLNPGKKSSPLLRNSTVLMNFMGASRTRNKINPSKYSSVFNTDNLLNESNGVSFDQYLEDTPRVLNALFREEQSQQLDQDVWRIEMLPVQLLFLTVTPVVEMRVKCQPSGEVCLPQVPPDIANVLNFSIMKWVLHGLNVKPSHFDFSVRGVIYPDRRQLQPRLKGHLEMDISYSLPPTLSFVPKDLLSKVFEEVSIRI
ncbi:hypothetical protein CDL15_Pgr004537 [Punica granatum]|uniref:Uncharacterized protein n=1 Tax=Punica granatum TaxID=22663 RepID=A0A218WQY4_PUNGR|nr:hypothetical protein CDL15_Pgr004537 [Punica granatum]